MRSKKFFSLHAIGFLFLLLAILPGKAMAHPNGTSKIRIEIRDPDTLWFSMDVNRDDVLSTIQEWPSRDSANHGQYQRLLEKSAYYLQSRLKLEVNNKGISDIKVVSWTSTGKTDINHIDSADIFSPTFIMSFATKLAEPQGKLAVGVQLFLELGVQPLSEVSIYWHGKLVQRTWVTTDKMIRLPMLRDSLQARAEATTDTTRTSATSNIQGGFFRFVSLGFLHILPRGLDHILFVVGLFFFSTLLRPLLLQVTAFTLAHSLTLGLSLLGVVNLPSRIVEPLIALSIAVIAIENIFFRKLKPTRWLIVFLFGLVHGLGFAGVLKELGIPKSEFWSTLIGFNLGVELGQLTVVSLAVLATVWFWKKRWYFRAIVVPVSTGIAMVGLYWAVQRAFFP